MTKILLPPIQSTQAVFCAWHVRVVRPLALHDPNTTYNQGDWGNQGDYQGEQADQGDQGGQGDQGDEGEQGEQCDLGDEGYWGLTVKL